MVSWFRIVIVVNITILIIGFTLFCHYNGKPNSAPASRSRQYNLTSVTTPTKADPGDVRLDVKKDHESILNEVLYVNKKFEHSSNWTLTHYWKLAADTQTNVLLDKDYMFTKVPKNVTFAIVVSHCSEDLAWLMKHFLPLCVSNKVELYVYQKCSVQYLPSEILKSKCKVHRQTLPNVGREGHTFLHHLLFSNANLQDINFYLQGGTESCPHELISAMNTMIKFHEEEKRSKNKSLVGYQHWLPMKRMDIYCPNFPMSFFGFGATRDAYQKEFCSWFNLITGGVHEDDEQCFRYTVSFRGEWVATKNSIKRMINKHENLLKDLYKKLLREKSPIEGYYLELLWCVLFERYELECLLQTDVDDKIPLEQIHCLNNFNY